MHWDLRMLLLLTAAAHRRCLVKLDTLSIEMLVAPEDDPHTWASTGTILPVVKETIRILLQQSKETAARQGVAVSRKAGCRIVSAFGRDLSLMRFI